MPLLGPKVGSIVVGFRWSQARWRPASAARSVAVALGISLLVACSASVTPHPRLIGPAAPQRASAAPPASLPPVAQPVPRHWPQQRAPGPAQTVHWRPWQANTLSTQILMTPVGLAAGIVAGAIAASLLPALLPSEDAGVVIGFGLGLGTGVAATTWLAGAAFGGTGRWAPTWAAGALSGGAAAAMLVYFGGGESVGAWGLAAVVTGPILAYHASAEEVPPPRPLPSSALNLQWAPPTLAPTFDRAGSVAGWQLNLLQGRF